MMGSIWKYNKQPQDHHIFQSQYMGKWDQVMRTMRQSILRSSQKIARRRSCSSGMVFELRAPSRSTKGTTFQGKRQQIHETYVDPTCQQESVMHKIHRSYTYPLRQLSHKTHQIPCISYGLFIIRKYEVVVYHEELERQSSIADPIGQKVFKGRTSACNTSKSGSSINGISQTDALARW